MSTHALSLFERYLDRRLSELVEVSLLPGSPLGLSAQIRAVSATHGDVILALRARGVPEAGR